MAYLCEAVLQFAGSARNGTYLACRWVCERSRGVLRPCEANDGDPPGRQPQIVAKLDEIVAVLEETKRKKRKKTDAS